MLDTNTVNKRTSVPRTNSCPRQPRALDTQAQTVAGLHMWYALSDETTGLSFTTAASPHQRSHFWVLSPQDLLPYFTVSDQKLIQYGAPCPLIYIPQRQGGPIVLPDTGSLSTSTNLNLTHFCVMYKDSVRTSRKTHYVTAAKANWLILFRETIVVYYENHKEHTNTLCEQKAEFRMLKQVTHIVTAWL
jgi:hypothetical protein